MSVIINGTDGVQFNDASLQGAAASPFGLKNRIINGAMVIDQRNAGASITPTTSGTFSVDRWGCYLSATSKYSAQQNAASVTPPTGFSNYLGITSLAATAVGASDFYFIAQSIEGYNIADLGFGTANAKTVTVSFWVRSSLTGTFGGSIRNAAGDRSYPFTYTILAANTWEQKTVTIAGDTSGTWLVTNGVGFYVSFGLGIGSTYSGTAGSWQAGNYIGATGGTSVVGTNGATFYITGVQLEQNTSATPFERRLYDKELVSCYRYFRNYNTAGTMYGFGSTTTSASIAYRWGFTMDVAMRAVPTVSLNSCLGWANITLTGAVTVSSNISSTNNIDCDLTYSGATGGAGLVMKVYANPPSGSITVNAEL
jgi:hypothetical protein